LPSEQTKRTTDELVHWPTARLYWLGDHTFQLEVNTAIEPEPVNWLNHHLAERLKARLDTDVGVEAVPARRTTGGFADFGELRISGLPVPLLRAGELRELVNEAVADAHDTADTANSQAAEWLKELRRGS
jgi:hypothetical protein